MSAGAKRRETDRMIRELERRGCCARRGGSGHWRITGANGVTVTVPASPSSSRSIPNTLALLRRRLNVDLRRAEA